MRTSAAGLEPFIFRLKRSHPKIGDLQGEMIIQQQVLRLEVTVTNSKRVKVMETIDELLKEEGGLVGLEVSLCINVVK